MTIDMLVLAQDANDFGPGLLVVAGVVFVATILFLAIFARYFGLWIQSKMTRAGVSFPNLVMMSIRKVNPTVMVRSKIMAVQAGLPPIATRALEAHYLAGRDVLEAVRTSVNPKVIDCPDPKKKAGTLDAVAGDGIQLKARARVTVRTNIRQLIGGATEETIIARVGQGIVQAIGSTSSYKKVLENPDNISKIVLNQGLEAQTAYEIVSIDIADIDVGDNIGAQLMADQAEADMRVAQAKAEQRRAEGRAREQEMIARVQENRAKVVLAEADVPLAISEAFRSGRLGLLDFQELKNLQADTRMRAAIAGDGKDSVTVAPQV